MWDDTSERERFTVNQTGIEGDLINEWSLYVNGVSVLVGSFNEVARTAKSKGEIVYLEISNLERTIYITEQKYTDDRVRTITETVHQKQEEQMRRHVGYIDNYLYKFCWACKQSKHVSEFGVRKSNKDGLATNCKKCINNKARRYRKGLREEDMNDQKEY